MAYLEDVLRKYAVPSTVEATFRALRQQLEPQLLNCWKVANPTFYYGGSYAKRTMISGGYDLDLLVYFPPDQRFTVQQLYQGVEERLRTLRYTTRRHNVAIRLPYDGFHVDVVPARAQDNTYRYATLYASEGNTTKQTSIKVHIDAVRNGGNQDVIKVLKIWKRIHSVPIRSFVLELATAAALYNNRDATLEGRVWKVLLWLRDSFIASRLVDPANSNNVVSASITAAEKTAVYFAAWNSCAQRNWAQVVS